MTKTIGQRLKAAREAQKLTLEKVFEETRIRVQYLQALEADDLTSVPSPVQARGYLRNYAQYLGLDFEVLLDELRALSQQPASGEVVGPADSFPAPRESSPLQDGSVLQLSEVGEAGGPVGEEAVPAAPPPEAANLAPVRPGRRKGTASRPQTAAADAPTKRRGRKKIQPEPEPAPVPEPEAITPAEPAPPTGPAPEPAEVAQPEALPTNNATGKLWQRWLNRLGSVLPARRQRPARVQQAGTSSEDIPDGIATVPEHLPDDGGGGPSAEEPKVRFEKSAEIFKEIGAQLRERRELLSLHLDEVERNTHVKAHYLEALERGAMDELPSTVQTRGMLSNYATFLDMDVDALLLRFADALQARHRERNPQKRGRKPGEPIVASVPPIRTFVAGDIIFGVGMAVLLVGFAIWGVSRVVELQSRQDVQPTAPSISDVLLASPDPSQLQATATLQPVGAFPGPATVTIVVPTQDVNVDVQLNLVAVERTYMRVIVDGEVAFEGRVVPGNAYPFQAESQIEVLVGSGAAIRTVYNGRDLGLMGTFGQIVNNIYTASEVITPTALPSPSPTITVPVTPSPTATPSATGTPAPSDTPAP